MFFDISFGIRPMYNFQEIFSYVVTPRSVTEISLFISKLFSVMAVGFKICASWVQGNLVETEPFINMLQFLATLLNQNKLRNNLRH